MNKKRIFYIALLLGLVLSSGCGGIDSKIELFSRFGQDDFVAEQWKSGDPVDRGRMIYRYLKERSPLKQLSLDRIRKDLGESTAYYQYDYFPAYYLGPKPPGSSQPGYLFAFVVDHVSGLVTDIHIEPRP